MVIREVVSQQEISDFLELPYIIYQGDNQWIPPLRQDIEMVFNKAKNPYFSHGTCIRWILYNDTQQPIGRIAAFINNKTKDTEPQPTGGCGFFECINDKPAATLLFDTAKNWLVAQGIEAMDGPINFGEKNAWWGLLVDGFIPPVYQMNYNPPYYKKLFEDYGFTTYFEQYSYSIDINAERPEKYNVAIQKYLADPDFEFRHFEAGKAGQYAADFRTVYNAAWSIHPGFKQMSEKQAQNIIKALKPAIIDYLVWFAYHKGQPIAMFIMLPELNQWFKKLNGNLNLIGKLRFLWMKHFDASNRKIFGIVFGVVPEFQKKGMEGAIVMAADNVIRPKKRWDIIELTWIASFNPRMLKTVETLGGKLIKTHITYRLMFDKSKGIVPHEVIH